MSITLIQSKYRAAAAFAVGLAAVCSPSHASASEPPGTLATISAFVQAGFGDQHTNTYVVGATWYLPWHFDFSVGTVAASVEASVGRWHTQGPKGGTTAWPTQFGAAPVLRLYPARAPDWFGEIGIGPNYIVPIFHSGDKRFSTEFNFGDHAAIGRRFGASEVSLRVEHFSNAGISHPNPGENFLQVRYAHRL
jgi:lipid A 3-O-deacylase